MTQTSIHMADVAAPRRQNSPVPAAAAPNGSTPFRPSLASRTSQLLHSPAISATNAGRLQAWLAQAEAAATAGDHAAARKSALMSLQFVQSRLGSEIALDSGGALFEAILQDLVVPTTSTAELTQVATGLGRDFLAVQMAAPRSTAVVLPDPAVDRSAQTAQAISEIKACRLPTPVEQTLIDSVMALETAVGIQDPEGFLAAAVTYNGTVASLSEVAISPLAASSLVGVVGRIYPVILWIIIVAAAFAVIVGGFYYYFSEAPSAGAFRKITRLIEKGKNPKAQDVRDTVRDALKGLTQDQINEVRDQVRKRINDVAGENLERYKDYVTAFGEVRKQSD